MLNWFASELYGNRTVKLQYYYATVQILYHELNNAYYTVGLRIHHKILSCISKSFVSASLFENELKIIHITALKGKIDTPFLLIVLFKNKVMYNH